MSPRHSRPESSGDLDINPPGVRDADRLTVQYGGNPGDWAKMGGENSDQRQLEFPREL